MNHTSRYMEGNAAESNVYYDSLAQVVSDEKNISKGPWENSHDILGKNVTAFCSCPKKSMRIEEFGINVVGRGDFKTS